MKLFSLSLAFVAALGAQASAIPANSEPEARGEMSTLAQGVRVNHASYPHMLLLEHSLINIRTNSNVQPSTECAS